MLRWAILRLALATLVVAAALCPRPTQAAESAAVGYWQTYDDKTGKPNGVVQLYLNGGKLFGRIAKLRPQTKPEDKCTKCSGSLKDKPFLNLLILWDLKPDGSENDWSGGTVLDPDTGDTYQCTIKTLGTSKLEIRGFVGISLFGRTQTWERVRP
jgi:uncharacterized protein (DUF2147 family)